ncbi:hypothetical protein [Microcoleus vaginatus]|uniref:hypothetical protein n=1 Tax=Microcoleus vaginatus TaxID=119532 RepID=UPI001686BA18|nr:hypothetical protein [Microcoleus sp. FACHB-84]
MKRSYPVGNRTFGKTGKRQIAFVGKLETSDRISSVGWGRVYGDCLWVLKPTFRTRDCHNRLFRKLDRKLSFFLYKGTDRSWQRSTVSSDRITKIRSVPVGGAECGLKMVGEAAPTAIMPTLSTINYNYE